MASEVETSSTVGQGHCALCCSQNGIVEAQDPDLGDFPRTLQSLHFPQHDSFICPSLRNKTQVENMGSPFPQNDTKQPEGKDLLRRELNPQCCRGQEQQVKITISCMEPRVCASGSGLGPSRSNY